MNETFEPSFTAFPSREDAAPAASMRSVDGEWIKTGNLRARRALILVLANLLVLASPAILYKSGHSLTQTLIALLVAAAVAVISLPFVFAWSVSSVRRGGRWSPLSLFLGLTSGSAIAVGLVIVSLVIWQAEAFGLRAALSEYF